MSKNKLPVWDPMTEAFIKAGSARRLAIVLGVSTQAVHQWRQQGYCPLARALQIESLYGIPAATLVHSKFLKKV